MNHPPGGRISARLKRQRAVVAFVAIGAVGATFTPLASAVPIRGNTPWSVLMCTYSDSVGTPPKSAAEVGDFFVNPGTGGAADYWADQSFGAISLSGSSVHGWYRSTMSLTTSQDPNTQRWQRIAGCVDAARADARDPYTAPAGTRTVVYMDKCVDSGFQGSVLMDPCAPWLAFAAHEMGHGYSLDHSFSNRSTDAEYDDPWDIMSAMNVHWFDGVYPRSGPGLVADQRDRLGWIGRSKVTTFGADGATDATVLVAPLDSPSAGGSQLIRVPYDPANARRYYTVELDAKRGWDRGIYADTVLIHKLRDDHQPALLRDFQTEAAFPTQHLRDAANDVTIDVVSTSSSGAVVRIHSGLPGRCRQGFVWREASPSDHVCVTTATRTRTRAENASARSRVQPGGGPFGPDTCRVGFVWREAFSGDHVCVPPTRRSQAQADNARANDRNNPARLVFGPNTCAQGFVWREADDRDYVCVTPTTRTQTQADNAAASSRVQPGGGPFGPDTCVQGFVWRDAFHGDHVCVVPAQRDAARADNDSLGRYAF